MTTLETLQDLLIEEYALDRDALAPGAELATLGVDSLGLVELLFKIEDRFGVQIPNDAPTELRTVGDVVAYIDTLLAAPRAVGAGLRPGA